MSTYDYPPIKDLFEDADDSMLVEAIASTVLELKDRPARKDLKKEHLNVWYVWESSGRVSNGGFQCFFESWELDYQDRLAALEAIGAEEAVSHLKAAAGVFPGGIPHEDVDERLEYLESLSEEEKRPVEEGGYPLYHDDILPLLSDYVRARREIFLQLPKWRVTTIVPLPKKVSPPKPDASADEIAKWIAGLDGTTEFHDLKDRAGKRLVVMPKASDIKELRRIQGFRLPCHRRDTADTLSILGSLKHAQGIEQLSLEKCRIGAEGIKTLQSFSELLRLELNGAHIDDRDMGVVARVGKLEILDVSGTKVTSEGLSLLSGHATLRTLRVDGIQLKGEWLGTIPHLEELTIGYLKGDPSDLSFLSGASSLTELSVHRMALSADAMGSIARLPRLRELLLWKTGLKEEDLARLKGHAAVESLSLEGMSITIAGAEILSGFPMLKELQVGDIKITAEARTYLEQHSPGCKIT